MNREELLHESLPRDVLNSGMKGEMDNCEINLEGETEEELKKKIQEESVRAGDGGYPLETKAGKGRM